MKSFLEINDFIGPIEINFRDYMAAKAMQGMIDSSIESGVSLEFIAESAYRMADAMMEARNESI
jgi:hypothetical protein